MLRPDPEADAGSDQVLIDLKALPGSRRDQVVGPLGDRLKVKVAAPASEGAANEAIRRLLAASLGLKPGAVEIVSGRSSPEKTSPRVTARMPSSVS